MGNCIKDYNLKKSTIDTPEFKLTGTYRVKVVDVYDGDTLTITFYFNNKIYKAPCRIEGIDCLEIKSKNPDERQFAQKAKTHVKQLLLDKLMWVDFTKKDKYGRLLGKFRFSQNNGESLDEILIRDGWGYKYNGEKKRKFN